MKTPLKFFLFLGLTLPSVCQGFTTHLIQFGGTFGFTYFPASMKVYVLMSILRLYIMYLLTEIMPLQNPMDAGSIA